MTAKEKLRQAVEGLSEAEAADALETLARRDVGAEPDAMSEFLEGAPIDDEPETEEERKAVAEGYEALRRGDTVGLDEIDAERA